MLRRSPDRARLIRSSRSKGALLGLDRDDFRDPRDLLAQDALDPLLEGDRRKGARFTGSEELNRHPSALDAFELDVSAVHLDGGTHELQCRSHLSLEGSIHPCRLHRSTLTFSGYNRGSEAPSVEQTDVRSKTPKFLGKALIASLDVEDLVDLARPISAEPTQDQRSTRPDVGSSYGSS